MGFAVNWTFRAKDQFSPVVRKIKKQTETLRKSIKGVSREVGMAGRAFSTKFKTRANAAISSVRAKMAGLESSLKSFGRKTLGAGAAFTAFATLPIGLLGKSFINAASDAEETRSKFASVFGDVGADAERMADSLVVNFGLGGTSARKLLGDTGDLLTGFGFSGKAALNLSNQVNELAVDLASFTNVQGGAARTSAALNSAMVGEREALKSLGIVILEKDIIARGKQLELAGKLTGMTLRQAKAQITLQMAIEQSPNAIGDFNKTSQKYANQVRIMSERTIDMKESFGRILIPFALKAVRAISSLSVTLSNMSPNAQKAILAFGGFVAVIGPILIIVGALSLAIGSIGLAVTGVVVAFAAFGIAVFAFFEPIKLFLVDIAIGVGNVFSSVINGISTGIDTLVTKLASIMETISSFAAKVGDIFSIGAVSGLEGVRNIKDIRRGGRTLPTPQAPLVAPGVGAANDANATVDVNIHAPQGVVNSVKTQKNGSKDAMNLGVNLVEAR